MLQTWNPNNKDFADFGRYILSILTYNLRLRLIEIKVKLELRARKMFDIFVVTLATVGKTIQTRIG